MSTVQLDHVRMQYAVGQGGFHAAYVQVTDEKSKCEYRFDYVYDCGALKAFSAPPELKWAIGHYEPRTQFFKGEGKCTVIDALIISHFDMDHMNGCVLLASKHKILRVYLPYLSPDELILQILSVVNMGGTISASYLGDLLAAANDSQIWGSPITRVSGGEPFAAEGFEQEGSSPDPFDRDRVGDLEGVGGSAPLPMEQEMESDHQPVGATLPDTTSVVFGFSGNDYWKLRFWNFRSQNIPTGHVVQKLAGIGFPTSALNSPVDVWKVVKWLRNKTNRNSAIKAYKDVIKSPVLGVGISFPTKDFANRISLSMYSGPVGEVYKFSYSESSGAGSCSDLSNICCLLSSCGSCSHSSARFGWIGTGDAPLGEANVWQDFFTHYSTELPETLSVLMPHHGAAPKSGPVFYNKNLNMFCGTRSVISVGARNTYLHPRPSVLNQILKFNGQLRIVNENASPGFVEFVSAEM